MDERVPIRAAWERVTEAIQAWIDVMPDVEGLPPLFHVVLTFEDQDTGQPLRYYPLRMAQGIGVPMEPLPTENLLWEMANYQPMAIAEDAPAIDRERLIRYLEGAMAVRIHLAQGLTVSDRQTAGFQLAMANLFYGLLEKVEMGVFDQVDNTPE